LENGKEVITNQNEAENHFKKNNEAENAMDISPWVSLRPP
jgi:hypothetical protein